MTDSRKYAELLVHISRPDGEGAYQVDLSFDRADQNTLPQPVRGKAEFDFASLPDPSEDAPAYGQRLRDFLFASPELLTHYQVCLANVQSGGMELCVRLAIDPSALELHQFKWETLQRPGAEATGLAGSSPAGSPLAANQNVPFSRFLYSPNWDRFNLRAKGGLRALVVVANPAELSANPNGYTLNTHRELQDGQPRLVGQSLAPVDIEAELKRILPALNNVTQIDVLESRKDPPERPTIENIRRKLQEGWDIFYLVCHGVLMAADITKPGSRRRPVLVLEDAEGRLQRVEGEELTQAVQTIPIDLRPRLAVLVSCQSAGSDEIPTSHDKGALSALGPQMVEAGVPAVIAMQGNARMDSMDKFIPRFFFELQSDGRVDRAMAAARQEIMNQPDWWVPVLYQRLKSGRVWYTPGFGGDQNASENWEEFKTFISYKKCTPIIGPALAEPWTGLQVDLAEQWAKSHGFPFDPEDLDNLPRIAQYMVRRRGSLYLRMEYLKALQGQIVARHADDLPADLDADEPWEGEDLLKAFEAVALKHWQKNPKDPHLLLAQMKLPIYITTSHTNLIELALKQTGADPQMRLCPWWKEVVPKDLWNFEEKPTKLRPLVYHLFGHLKEVDSLVLSEDDYFDFLIGFTRSMNQMIPSSILNATASTALLFQGFHMDEWSFRVLFRTLMALPGSDQLKNLTHVAAQIEPEENRMIDLQRARKHMETYFAREKISIFWGRSEEFLTTLSQND